MDITNKIKALSIRRKLMLMMMASSGLAIILMACLVVINQAINSQHAIQQQLTTLADVLGTRSTGALTFDDPETGTEILNSLVLQPNIIYARIERQDGELFATYGDLSQHKFSKKFMAKQPVAESNDWNHLFSNQIQVKRNIYLENETIGQISIISTKKEFYSDLLNYVILIILVSGLCFTITMIIGTRLQKVVSDPILNLQKAMRSVSENKDYSLRVENFEQNELGFLIASFNHMLQQIQVRDHKLGEHSTHLEKMVAERSLQLTDANKKRILWLETMARFLRHELKNSSVGIKTSLDLIERRHIEQKKVDVYIARARKSMSNMNALLQSAGDASDLEASLYKEVHHPLDLGHLVTCHQEIYDVIFPDFSIIIQCEPGAKILGNENRLIQLLDKLVSNAVEHSEQTNEVKVIVRRDAGHVQLIVSNKGAKLPVDKLSIFDLFVSFRSAERKTDDNFGLGLYIAKLIAESHQGHIVAYDLAPESGAVFKVSLPLIITEL